MLKNKKELQEEKANFIVSSHVTAASYQEGPFHWHEAYEICQILKASCSVVINGKRIDGNEGDLFCIDSHQPHYYMRNSDDSILRFFLFSPKQILKISKDYYPLKEHILYEEIKAIDGLEQVLNTLLKALDTEGRVFHADPFIQSAAASIYYLLVRHFKDTQPQKNHLKKSRSDFFRAVEYINEHLTEPITTISLAEKLFVSRGHLARVFIQYSGMSISDYVNSLRIQKANDLMSNGTSITEAAMESGFQNIRSFNIIYKKQMGVTPSEFLKTRR